jgi:hypothetical protein
MSATQIVTVNLSTPEGDVLCDLEVEPLPNGLYPVAEIPFGPLTPFKVDLEYQDVVELVPGNDGTHVLRSIRNAAVGVASIYCYLLGSLDRRTWNPGGYLDEGG